MAGLAAPLLKRGVMDRIEKSLIRRAMGIMTAQAGGACGLHAVMDIPETKGLIIVAGEAEFCCLHFEKALAGATMGIVAQPAILAGRGMGHTVLPVFFNILMTGKTKIGLLLHKKLLFTGTVGHMAYAAIHCLRRGVNMFSRLNHLGHILMTGEADLALTQDKGVITGMGIMTGLAPALHKGLMTMILGLLRTNSLMAGQTELTPINGRL